MKRNNNLSSILKSYQNLRNISVAEFSKELDIPDSTLRALLKDSNTTLDTAVRISNSLGISLDNLVFDNSFSNKLFILRYMGNIINWHDSFPTDKKEKLASLMADIWEVLK